MHEELRRNAAARIAQGRPLVDRVLGFDDTVLPQLENALLAGHDIIFLGERGQAKTRLVRSLTALLDEWLPVVAGSEIRDDPDFPASCHAATSWPTRATPPRWRGFTATCSFSEKLASPDTSISDLIGEVDPIKIAEGPTCRTSPRCTTASCPAPTGASSPSTSSPTWPSASRWAS